MDTAIADADRLATADKVDEAYLSPAGPVERMGQDGPAATDPGRQGVRGRDAGRPRPGRVAAPRGGGERGLTDHKVVQEVQRAIDFGLENNFRNRDTDVVQAEARQIAGGLRQLKAMRDGSPRSTT